ncbi:MAG: protein kinase domain-containing protein, partial [Anaerolineae bacterium]
MPLTQGQILQQRYRVEGSLGEGGMGAVYRAWDLRLDTPVALKEMVPQPGLDASTLAQLREQFEQEAKVLARLRHPHLVGVTDFFEESGNTYLVMEFMEGKNLAAYIEEEGPLPEDRVLVWADELLDALAYCHNQGILHRDVKPQNIVIQSTKDTSPRSGGTEGGVILVDFGLVKLWDPTDPKTQTVMRGLGTPEYAPPEQYSARLGHTDPRSDVYSLGATLYHALTGEVPWSATDRMADPEQFPPLRDLQPSVSEETASVVMKALNMARSQRWQSADAMRRALPAPSTIPAPPPPEEETVAEETAPVDGHGGTVKMEEKETVDVVEPPPPPPVVEPEPTPEPTPWKKLIREIEEEEEALIEPYPETQPLGERLAQFWDRVPRHARWLVPLFGLLLIAGIGLMTRGDGDLLAPQSVLFTSTRDGRREIYRLTAEGTTERVTQTPLRAESWDPARAANGTLLFTSNRTGKREIYRLNVDGETEQVTNSPTGTESWAPIMASNGAVLFTSTRNGKREIYRLTAEGTTEQVTHTPGDGESWAPFMTRSGGLLFTSTRAGKREIYRLTSDGTTERVTQTPGDGESWDATVTSNGAVLFTSTRDGKREIYRLTAEGTTEQVTH